MEFNSEKYLAHTGIHDSSSYLCNLTESKTYSRAFCLDGNRVRRAIGTFASTLHFIFIYLFMMQ